MLTVPMPPVTTVNGDQLSRELHAAGYRDVEVIQRGADELLIGGHTAANGHPLDEQARSQVESVVAAHEYVPVEQRIADLQASVADLSAQVAWLLANAVIKPNAPPIPVARTS